MKRKHVIPILVQRMATGIPGQCGKNAVFPVVEVKRNAAGTVTLPSMVGSSVRAMARRSLLVKPIPVQLTANGTPGQSGKRVMSHVEMDHNCANESGTLSNMADFSVRDLNRTGVHVTQENVQLIVFGRNGLNGSPVVSRVQMARKYACAKRLQS